MLRLLTPLLLVLALALAGCGSGSATSSTSTTAARQFETRGGDNSIQRSGVEAPIPDREEAERVLHGYLDARAGRAWGAACGYLASGLAAELRQLSDRGGKPPSCGEVLAALSAGVATSELREAALADVGSFRIAGDSGFLLLEDARGVDWFVPMVRESSRWRVAAVGPSPLR